jgi:Ca-activated chloride channel family protein
LRNKHFLLVGLGVLGAETGTVAAQIMPFGLESFLMRIVTVALWAGIICAGLSLGLFTAIELYHRRPVFRPMKSLQALGLGAICGVISGATAQAAFNLTVGLPDAIHEYVFKPICWGIMGTLLGLCLTLAVPNLRRTVAAWAGASGGIFGGFGFLLSAAMIALLPGRMVGCGILAAALALAVSLAEVVFREAYLDITWAPNETSQVSLGPQVVYVGGGAEDTIVIPGAKPRESGFVMENGRVEHLESPSGKRTALSNGTRLRVGAVEIEVHCK